MNVSSSCTNFIRNQPITSYDTQAYIYNNFVTYGPNTKRRIRFTNVRDSETRIREALLLLICSKTTHFASSATPLLFP